MRDLSTVQRNQELHHHIDPGFINYRKCFSVFGSQFIELLNRDANKGTDHLAKLENDHLLVHLALLFCKKYAIKTLGEVLFNPQEGELFCSTERLQGTKDVYRKPRVRNRVIVPYERARKVFLDFGTEHLTSDTCKMWLSMKSNMSIIGEIRDLNDEQVIIEPLIMGAPTLHHPWNKDSGLDQIALMRHGSYWYETFPEDIDEFSVCKNVLDPTPNEWMEYMKQASEKDIKDKFCEIIGDKPRKDWGGEQNDHFSVSIHLSGKRVSTAFLLKGPARFQEMSPNLLGKRADQIYRLASTPAELLIVQHCHTIGEAVRATLRAFSVSPSNPRRYCLIDGKDTYKILKAYGKL